MAKRVFFSFDYQDVCDFRANVVRRHWMTKPGREAAGFFDASLWESAKKIGPAAIKRLINDGLNNTSVTCVLVGSGTCARPWVRYELLESFRRGNAMLAVHINSIKDKNSQTKPNAPNPLAYVGVTFSADGQTGTMWEVVNGEWIRYSGSSAESVGRFRLR